MSYDVNDSGRIPIIVNWLGCKGLHFIQTLTGEEQETCKGSAGLINTLNVQFKLQHNETVLLLHYCKLNRDENVKAEEWISHLRVKVNESNYKECDRQLTE